MTALYGHKSQKTKWSLVDFRLNLAFMSWHLHNMQPPRSVTLSKQNVEYKWVFRAQHQHVYKADNDETEFEAHHLKHNCFLSCAGQNG